MDEEGLPREEVLTLLREYLRSDKTFTSGKILGSMCTQPHQFASAVYASHLEKNLGDPGLFPGTAKLEREVVLMLGMLHSHPNAEGHIVSGGTEANILALWAARNLALEAGEKERNQVVVQEGGHVSLDKAANMLGLELVRVRRTAHYRLDVTALEEKVSEHTLAVVGVAGTTDLGVIDPVQELSEIVSDNNIYLHVDAAFGGMITPFMEELGYDVPKYDFRLPGVCSMTVDPHKMGMAPIPSGGILFRSRKYLDVIRTRVPYLGGGEATYSTVTCTRPGASAVATWALFKHMGRKGYRETVRRIMDMTKSFLDGLSGLDWLEVVTPPMMNIVGVRPSTKRGSDVRRLASLLRQRGWSISTFPTHIRIVFMPHLREEHVQGFLGDLRSLSHFFGS